MYFLYVLRSPATGWHYGVARNGFQLEVLIYLSKRADRSRVSLHSHHCGGLSPVSPNGQAEVSVGSKAVCLG